MLTDPPELKRQWGLRMVKPRYGIETLRDAVLDRRYGGSCGGTYKGRWGDLGYRGTSSAHYGYLAKLFSDKYVTIRPDDVLVDIGSGKGRVLNFWLHKGLRNRLIGIEIDDRWATFAADRLQSYPNVEVICGDVFEVIPKDGTIFFLFNPFSPEVCERFKDLLRDLRGPGADITLVYYMSQYGHFFEDDPAWDVTHVTDDVFHPAIIARLAPVS